MDKDLTFDDKIGTALLDFHAIPYGTPTDVDLKIKTKKGKEAGTIHFTVSHSNNSQRVPEPGDLTTLSCDFRHPALVYSISILLLLWLTDSLFLDHQTISRTQNQLNSPRSLGSQLNSFQRTQSHFSFLEILKSYR